MNDPIRKLALKDGRYAPEAFQFLFESLDPALRLVGREQAAGAERHVSGNELLAGMRQHALDLFGPLAAGVWRSWGIRDTLDWGRIVFLLVDAGMLNRQETDSIEDFRDGFDFEDAFVKAYRPRLPPELVSGGSPGEPGDEA
ncbi:MAG: Minf_1886 family protein [Planctomycetota bacterium]